jgi:pilus assembly protein FimV
LKNPHLTLTLAVALGLASPSLSAMGLGPLQVKSGLNQPLVAEIPIISATPSELEQLDVRLASPEAFARIGLERPGELTANLQFSVGKNSRGQPVILVTTPGRFSEPLLNFLIEAEWGKGTVTREYTALIDPPYIASAVVKPMQAPTVAAPVAAPPVVSAPAVEPMPEPVQEAAPIPAQAPEIVEQAPPPAPEPAPYVAPAPAPAPVAVAPEPQPEAQPEPEPAPPPRPVAAKPRPAQPAPAPPPAAPEPVPAPAPTPGQYGPVAPGQTLWSIANAVRPDTSISVNQMMVALLRANPEAFAQENVNRLKQGSVLRVPGQDEATRLSATQAAELVNQQASAWRTPRTAVPQPVEIATPSENINAAPPIAAAPARPSRAASSRLEIVPPSGNAAARGTQSGAAAGAGGTELRAELVQAREDLAARTSEVDELKSRVAELEKQDADRQRLIEMQNSQMKELQDRLNQVQQAPTPAPVAPAADATATAAPAAADAAPAKPWYLNPLVVGGAVLVLLGGLVLAMRRSKSKPENEASGTRLSDDEALRASMAKTREAGERIKPEPVVAPTAPPSPPVDSELEARSKAVRAKPQDLEAHLNLLRLHHSRGNALDYEVAAQAMRNQLSSTMDPRWREAVIMGASLMPGHALFSQAGWNSPRYSDAEPKAAPSPPAPAPAAALPSFLASAEPSPVKVFEPPVEDSSLEFTTGSPRDANPDKEIDFGDQAAVMDETFGGSLRDIHRDEAKLMAEDESSATRIELAKAYLDIGDLDGARSMLEEVLAEGGPTAKAEAARLLKDMD